MKKTCFILIIALALSVGLISQRTEAQSKVIKKTVKKVVTPQIAPVEAPKTVPSPEAVSEPPAPPTEEELEVILPEESKGLFGWGINTDIGGSFLFNNNGGLFGARGNIIFSDPLKMGAAIGLAEDAFEYKLGLGAVAGKDGNNNLLRSLPLYADTTLYLKEGSLFGLDPFIGAGLNLNLYGSDQKSGGLGGEFYGGILADFGFEAGKTAFTLGYGSNKVEGGLYTEGVYLLVSQPFKL